MSDIELVDITKVLEIVSNYCPDDDGSCSKADADPREMLDEIEALSTIEAEPVKHGRWIKGKDWDDWFCSECSNKAALDWKENPILSSFCPDCGAKMDEKHKGKNADACFIDEPGNPRYV